MRAGSVGAWVAAARPKTLSAAAVPVAIGCALAAADGKLIWQVGVLCLAFACLMQIAANMINDLGDYLKGSDTAERLGPPRACAEGWITPKAMAAGIAVTITAACATGLCLLFWGSLGLVVVGVAVVLFAALYTPLAYRGMGDLLVVLFFGAVPVGFTYYIMADSWNLLAIAAGVACGLVVDTLLTINNFRDREQDAAGGKRTLVVRLGRRGGLWLYGALGVAAVGLMQLFWTEGSWLAAILPMFYLVAHLLTLRQIDIIDHGRELNRMLGRTSLNIVIFGVLTVIGILL